MKWSQLIPEETLNLGLSLADKAINSGQPICPAPENIFRALTIIPPESVKVCIVGQDPYHTPGVANGLSFSTSPDATKIPPSLNNIYKELAADLGVEIPKSGDLTPWAQNGVLLLNATLTTFEHKPNAHVTWGWDKFTLEILRAATRLPQPVIFMLWGSFAQKLLPNLLSCAAIYEPGEHRGIMRENLIKNGYIMSSHPSPFSANRPCGATPAFIGSRPFSTANRILVEMGGTPCDWTLPTTN